VVILRQFYIDKVSLKDAIKYVLAHVLCLLQVLEIRYIIAVGKKNRSHQNRVGQELAIKLKGRVHDKDY
jgi:NTP pyrophosphatase (non-canonical NTP hydrolase)